MSLNKIIIFYFSLLLSLSINAQNKKKVDSLLRALQTDVHDTEKVKAYVGLYNEYKDNEPDKALGFINRSIFLAERTGFKKGLQLGFINKSVYLFGKGSYDSAIYFCKQVSLIADKKTPKRNIGLSENILGAIKYRRGDFRDALAHFLNSVKIFEELNSKANAISPLNNISIIYLEQKNYKKALEESRKCSRFCIELNNMSILASTYQNQGNIFNSLKMKDSVIYYYNKSIELGEKVKNHPLVAHALNNLGAYYNENKEYKKGIDYLLRALKTRKEIDDKHGIAETLMHLGNAYILSKDFKKAEDCLTQAELSMKELGIPRELSQAYSVQSLLFEEKGQFKLALDKYKLFKQLNDSVFNSSSAEHITEVTAKYDSDKKDKEIKLLNKEKALQEIEAKAKSFQRNASLGGLVLVMIFAIFVFRGYKQKQKINKVIEEQKLQVEEKNKNITDSINYAKRIQDVILPAGNLLGEFFPEHFILFKPKDIVSGDFYWSTTKDDHFFLAVCDSTGHGVPGAFMSLLNIGFLSEAINEKNMFDPGTIFNYVRERLISTISKEGQKDGFDGVLLCLDRRTGRITYASSNNTPILISEGSITELKKDKMPVGQGEKKDSFVTHEFQQKKGDYLYLSTDGYADQFGGTKGKKFMYKKLHQLLLEISKEPLSIQKELLGNNLETWRGRLEQVDDVCVIGIKI